MEVKAMGKAVYRPMFALMMFSGLAACASAPKKAEVVPFETTLSNAEAQVTAGGADAAIWGEGTPADPFEVAEAMKPYIDAHLAAGGRLHQITRHMLGLFHARPGARLWKRLLSEAGPAGGLHTYDAALEAVGA